MENGDAPKQTYPEFPLPAYRNLSQVISLPITDGHCSEEIVASTVRIMATPANLEKTTSLLTMANIVNFARDDRHHSGRLMAVSRCGVYLAYVITVGATGEEAVRISSKNKRILVKGMKGCIQDMAFSQHHSELLLAVVDDLANLFVYKITEDEELNASEFLIVIHNEKADPIHGHRVVWIPYLRGEELESIENYRLLALLIGSKAEVWRVGIVVQEYGTRPLNPVDIKEGLTLIKGHSDIITDAAFSPDGSALATSSLDGSLQFFQVYMHKEPKCLHNWTPHEGRPLSFVAFLDNQNESLSDSGFWRFVITGANDNTELKIWNCSDWGHIQTISILSDQNQRLQLKASLDYTAKFLLLSDRVNKIFYLFRVVENESTAYIDGVSTYFLPFSILSFMIVDITMQVFNRSPIDADLDDDEAYYDEEESVAVLSIHVVHPKSLQDCKLQFLPPPKGQELILSTLVPDQVQVPFPINLMTPKELTSPAKPELDKIVLKLEPMESVEPVISSASSPSQEVRDILSSKEDDDSLLYSNENDLPKDVVVKEEPKENSEWNGEIKEKRRPSTPRRRSRSKNNMNGESAADASSSSKEDVSAIESKLDIILSTLQRQDAAIKDLQKRLTENENPWDTERVDRIVSTCSQMNQHLSVRDAKESDRQEALMSAIAQAFENLLASKLETTVPNEFRKNIIPVVRSDLEALKRGLHNEMTKQLSATDHLLRDSISKLVQNKSMMELLGRSLTSTLRSSVSDACKDIMMTFVLPRLEKVLENTFQQIHESFAAGTQECLTLVRKDVEQVKSELRNTERSLKESTDRNVNAVSVINSELEKNLIGVTEKLKKQLSEILQKELRALPNLTDGSASARALTPAVHMAEVKKVITQLIDSGNYNAALQEALSVSDLSIVVFTCEKMSPERLFGRSATCTIEQPVLLSLIQQLSADLSRHCELKCRFLLEAVLQLEVNHPLTEEHIPRVISEGERNISGFLASHPDSKQTYELTRILRIFKILIGGKLDSRS